MLSFPLPSEPAVPGACAAVLSTVRALLISLAWHGYSRPTCHPFLAVPGPVIEGDMFLIGCDSPRCGPCQLCPVAQETPFLLIFSGPLNFF